jgi:hypothetical protein
MNDYQIVSELAEVNITLGGVEYELLKLREELHKLNRNLENICGAIKGEK